MGVTSSGLLDEEIVDETATGSSTEIAAVDDTLTVSGERNDIASQILGRDVAGSPNVCYKGPTIYTLP